MHHNISSALLYYSINKFLTLTVHDYTDAEESSLLDSHDLQMDKRNIASVAREFFGTYQPR